MIPFIVIEMSKSNPRSWNQLLKGDLNKGQHKLTPFVLTVRSMLVKYEKLNKAIIDYINELPNNDPALDRLRALPPELLRRAIYDDTVYTKIINSN